MGLIYKLLGKTNERHNAFHRNLALLLKAQNIDLIFDIGANKGQYAETMFSLGYRGRIVSFEPGISAHGILSARAAGNERWAVAPRMALGSRREILDLYAFNRTDMNSLLAPTHDIFTSFPKLVEAEPERAQVERLDHVFDDFAKAADRILLKIDTQGSELAVLEGAAGCLHRIPLLQLEIPVVPVYKGAPSWMDILAPVHHGGFRPVLTSAGYFSKQINAQIDMDIIFLKQRD